MPRICSENVSKVFAPHPAKRFDPGEHYYLFVDVGTPEQALKAMDTLNGQEGPWGGPLRVQFARGPKETWSKYSVLRTGACLKRTLEE